MRAMKPRKEQHLLLTNAILVRPLDCPLDPRPRALIDLGNGLKLGVLEEPAVEAGKMVEADWEADCKDVSGTSASVSPLALARVARHGPVLIPRDCKFQKSSSYNHTRAIKGSTSFFAHPRMSWNHTHLDPRIPVLLERLLLLLSRPLARRNVKVRRS